jgi:hypothetical protein
MKRVQNVLLGEWSFALSLSLAQAERQLRHLLAAHSSRASKHSQELEANT